MAVKFIKLGLRLFQQVRCPIYGLAVVGLEHCQSDRFAVMLAQQILNGDDIAKAFRHLFALHQEIAVVHPVLGEPFRWRIAKALCNLVFVVRKDQVLAAAVNVECIAKVF